MSGRSMRRTRRSRTTPAMVAAANQKNVISRLVRRIVSMPTNAGPAYTTVVQKKTAKNERIAAAREFQSGGLAGGDFLFTVRGVYSQPHEKRRSEREGLRARA